MNVEQRMYELWTLFPSIDLVVYRIEIEICNVIYTEYIIIAVV